MPDAPEKDAPKRPDGCWETSINWEDDGCAIDHIIHKHFGVLRVSLCDLEYVEKLGQPLSKERRAIEGNPYHGNLLFPSERIVQKVIAGAIAIHAKKV